MLSEADTREYYNGETGVGLGMNPFRGWSAPGYFMLLEFEMGCDPTDLEREEIIPLGSDILGISFEAQE